MKFTNIFAMFCIMFSFIGLSYESILPTTTTTRQLKSLVDKNKTIVKRACMVTKSGRQICTAPRCFPDGTCVGK